MSFRHLASCERRALYLPRASFGEILPLPALWAKFHFRPLLGVKFTAAMSFSEILPSPSFPWHGTYLSYRVLWGKILLAARNLYLIAPFVS